MLRRIVASQCVRHQHYAPRRRARQDENFSISDAELTFTNPSSVPKSAAEAAAAAAAAPATKRVAKRTGGIASAAMLEGETDETDAERAGAGGATDERGGGVRRDGRLPWRRVVETAEVGR